MATKKSGGSSSNGRKTIGRRLGIKRSGGQEVNIGTIILRQRGTKWRPGNNVFMGKDHTIHAAIGGNVSFRKTSGGKVYVDVIELPIMN